MKNNSDMEELRTIGRNALSFVLKNKNNVSILEKNIYENTESTLKKYDSFDDIYRLNIFQIINDIHNNKYDLKTLLNNVKTKKMNWDHDFFNELKLEETEQDNFLIKPFEIEEGVLECKCGSKRVYSYSKQSRSADEPCSTYAQCMSCKSKWVYSG